MINMKGISPLIASVLLIAITMTLAAILATFVSNYTRQQLSSLPACVGGTLLFATADYPKLNGNNVVSVVEAGNVELKDFTVEAIDSSGTVTRKSVTGVTIPAGSSGTVTADFSGIGIATDDKVRVIAVNCPSVKTDWTSLK
jgi:flagellin-like protein